MAWVNLNLIKRRCFWLLKVPQDSTWSWRKILKLQDIAKNFLKFQVGDRSTISLWMDFWHPDGILFDQYGYRVIYDARSKIDDKLSRVEGNGIGCQLDLKLWYLFKVVCLL